MCFSGLIEPMLPPASTVRSSKDYSSIVISSRTRPRFRGRSFSDRYRCDANPMLTDWWSSEFVRTSTVFSIKVCDVCVCRETVRGTRRHLVANAQVHRRF